MFTNSDYDTLHSIVFATDAAGRPRYPGYRPELVELPNGDGRADHEKRYAHVSKKNIAPGIVDHEVREALDAYLCRAHAEAVRVARELGVPEAFMPDIRYGALRVLEYPPGATSARHTDFDLFTLLCYRDRPEGLVRHSPDGMSEKLADLDHIAPGLHLGELGEIVMPRRRATPHEVVPVMGHDRYVSHGPNVGTLTRTHTPQHSIVYFAIPDHAAVLPLTKRVSTVNPVTGERADVEWPQTVGQWLAERMARSRMASPK